MEDDHSDEEDYSIGSLDAQKMKGTKIQNSILEIIKDEGEEPAGRSSIDIQISEEIYMFLRRIDLEFLADCFNGEYSKINLT